MSLPSDAIDAAAPLVPADGGWQMLPARARPLFVLGALPLALAVAAPAFALSALFDLPRLLLVGLALLAGLAFAVGFGLRSHRYARWRLDAQGLAIRRGRSWLRETRVPLNRVQHLDLKQGPLQRARDLATLVVYTAGTRHSAVHLPNLDAEDARRLRDVLGEQIDHDDDA